MASASVDSGDDFGIDHLFGPDGSIHAVFSSAHDHSGVADTDPDIWYVRNDSTGWTPPILVNRHYGEVDTAWDRDPKIAIAPDGTLYCVWSTNFAADGLGIDEDILFAELPTGATSWSAPAIGLTNNASDDLRPALLAGPQGHPLVAWEGADPRFGESDRDVLWTQRTSTGWSSPEVLSDEAPQSGSGNESGLRLASDASGSLVVASWDSDVHSLTARQYSDDGFGNWSWGELVYLEQVPFGPHPSTLPNSLAIEPTRRADGLPVFHVVYSAFDAGWQLYHHRAYQSVDRLSPRVLVNSDAGSESLDEIEPTLCLEGSGALHVVWQRSDTGVDSDIAHVASSNPNDVDRRFSPPVLVGGHGAFDGPGEWDQNPDLACKHDGLISAMWNSQNTLGNTIGGDWDILHSLGTGLLFEHPQALRSNWQIDDLDDRAPTLAETSEGLLSIFPIFDEQRSHWLLARSRFLGEQDYWTGQSVMFCCMSNQINPAAATAPGGEVDLVFSSDHPFWGPDYDVFHSHYDGQTWSEPELVAWSGVSNDGDFDHDLEPVVGVSDTNVVHVAWAESASGRIIAYDNSSSGWGSGSQIPGNYADAPLHSAVSLALDGEAPHVAFVAIDPSTSQPAVFWSRRDPTTWWTPAEPIGPATWGSRAPVLVPDDGLGRPLVVWISDANVSGEGFDNDLLISRRDAGSWTAPQPLLLGQYFDVANDRSLVGFQRGARLHLAWISDLDLGGTAGLDFDVLYTDVPLLGAPPLLAPVLLADASGHTDQYADDAPAIVANSVGDVWVAWLRPDPQSPSLDWDPWASRRPSAGLIFQDGFEGPLARWQPVD